MAVQGFIHGLSFKAHQLLRFRAAISWLAGMTVNTLPRYRSPLKRSVLQIQRFESNWHANHMTDVLANSALQFRPTFKNMQVQRMEVQFQGFGFDDIG